MGESDINNKLLKKYSLFFSIIILTLTMISVAGLLQSTERVASSGIIVRPPPPIPATGGSTTPSVPPPLEPSIEIDLFEDPNCTIPVSKVVWGEIEAGGRSSVKLYVKNNGDVGVYLSLMTENWSPEVIIEYANISWDYNATILEPDDFAEIIIELQIGASCPEVPSFSFDIIIIGT